MKGFVIDEKDEILNIAPFRAASYIFVLFVSVIFIFPDFDSDTKKPRSSFSIVTIVQCAGLEQDPELNEVPRRSPDESEKLETPSEDQDLDSGKFYGFEVFLFSSFVGIKSKCIHTRETCKMQSFICFRLQHLRPSSRVGRRTSRACCSLSFM